MILKITKIVYLMFFVIFIAGCSSFNTFKQPQGKVIIDNKGYTMRIGDFEWNEGDFESRKISTSDKIDLAEKFETLDVKKGDRIKIEIEQSPSSIIVNQENEDGTTDVIEINDNEITLPSEEGYYTYEIKAKWNEGKMTFVFDVNIE